MQRLIKAFFYSLDGLKAAYKTQAAFRLECWLLIAAIILASMMEVSALTRVALVGVVVLILIIELINTAIEAAIDRHSTEQHPLSKLAKDAGSAAVLLACVLAAMVWIVAVF